MRTQETAPFQRRRRVEGEGDEERLETVLAGPRVELKEEFDGGRAWRRGAEGPGLASSLFDEGPAMFGLPRERVVGKTREGEGEKEGKEEVMEGRNGRKGWRLRGEERRNELS